MKKELLSAYKSIQQLHQALYMSVAEVRSQITNNVELTEVADSALLLRKSAELLHDSKVELDKLTGIMSNTAALVAAAKMEHVPNGEFANAHFRTKFAANLPSYKTQPELYEKVCNELDVPYNEMARLHYPTVRDHITGIIEKGGLLPPALSTLKQTEEVKLVAVETGDVDAAITKCQPLI